MIDARGRVSGEDLWNALHEADVLCAPVALRRELRHGPDRGLRRRNPGDRVRDRRLQRRGHRRRRRRPGPARRPAAPRRGAAARPPRARAAARRWARPPAAAPSATPGLASRTRSPRSTRRRSRRPLRSTPPTAPPAASASSAPTAARAVPARRLPSLDPEPEQRPRPQDRARRIGLGVAGALGIGLTCLAANRIGVDKVAREHRPLRPHLGADRLRPDGPLALRPRRLLVLRSSARPCPAGRCGAATSPRRRCSGC